MKKFTKKQRAAIYLKCAQEEFKMRHGATAYLQTLIGIGYSEAQMIYYFPETTLMNDSIKPELWIEWGDEIRLQAVYAHLFAHNIAKD